MTNSNGLFRQTIFYPYAWGIQYGRGDALNVFVESSSYEVKKVKGLDQAPYIDVAGARNSSDGSISLFILNRDLAKSHDVEIVWEDQAPTKVLNASVLTGDDLKAVNSFQSPQKVAPQAFTKPALSGSHTKFELPARSYTVIQFGA